MVGEKVDSDTAGSDDGPRRFRHSGSTLHDQHAEELMGAADIVTGRGKKFKWSGGIIMSIGGTSAHVQIVFR